jgi:magnesium transporter
LLGSREVPGEGLLWVDLEGPTAEEIELARVRFDLHELAIDDCLSTDHQPKMEDFPGHVFLIARGIDPTPGKPGFGTAKLAAFLCNDWLVTWHRAALPAATEVSARVRDKGERIFELGCDQVLYEILDRLVDSYLPELDEIGDELEEIEQRVFDRPEKEELERLLAIRRDLLHLRRHALPQRDLFNRLARGDVRFIDARSAPYYRDVHDHTLRVVDLVDNFRDIASGTLEAWLSMVANRTNDVMRVLTVITTIFIPLTFLAGVYGMNFKHMPELELTWTYPALWGVMIFVGGGLAFLFHRRRWL